MGRIQRNTSALTASYRAWRRRPVREPAQGDQGVELAANAKTVALFALGFFFREYLNTKWDGSKLSGQKCGVFGVIKRELRRRSAIEAVIGHMKNDQLTL